jgi:hypothetical protein
MQMLLENCPTVSTGKQWDLTLEMLRLVEFVIDTKTLWLKLQPKIDSKNWNLYFVTVIGLEINKQGLV